MDQINKQVNEVLPYKPYEYYKKLNATIFTNVLNSYLSRATYTAEYAWGVYTEETIRSLADLIKNHIPGNKAKVIDVAGGAGLLSFLLRAEGVNVDLNDLHASTGQHPVYTRKTQFVDVDIVKNASKIDYSEYDFVIFSWVTDEDWAVEVLRKLDPGTVVIHLGEGRGGCNGNHEFHDVLWNSFTQLESLSNILNDTHYSFPHIYDHWQVYQKSRK